MKIELYRKIPNFIIGTYYHLCQLPELGGILVKRYKDITLWKLSNLYPIPASEQVEGISRVDASCESADNSEQLLSLSSSVFTPFLRPMCS